MWYIAEMKMRGREAFKLNYWPCVIVSAIYMLLFGGNIVRGSSGMTPSTSTVNVEVNGQTISELTQGMTTEQKIAVAGVTFAGMLVAFAVAMLVKMFLVNPVEVGASRFFKNNLSDSTTGIGVLAEGFSDFVRTFLTLMLRDVIILLGCVLLIIPGIILMYSYRMVPYIVKDNPELDPMEVLKCSSQMMRGNKWRTFVLDLSFIGWYLLGAFTFGLAAVLWANPYHMSTDAALYLELKDSVA